MFGVEVVVVHNGKTLLQLVKESKKHDTVKFLKSYLQEVATYVYNNIIMLQTEHDQNVS